MLAPHHVRGWYLVHRWSSLVCTVFLLLLCLTGLPLVFLDEIRDWQSTDPPRAEAAEGQPRANLDGMLATARGPQGLFPGETVRWISLEDDRPEVWIALAPRYESDRRLNHVVKFDAHTGRPLKAMPSAAAATPTLMGVIRWLHKSLLLGFAGEMLLAGMGLLFIVATVSGVALYGPFMRKLDFGTVRGWRGARVRWLDLHNLLGITSLLWVLVVGITGVMNEVSEPMYGVWRASVLPAMLKPFEGKPMPSQLASAQAAHDAVATTLPGMKIRSLRFPDAELGSPHHYLVWALGDSPLTSRLLKPALVDAQTGQLAMVGTPPWYLSAVQLARPLHFGDYGGLPLKIIWVLLDLMAIGVLGSGLCLWFARRQGQKARVLALEQVHRGRDA